ncbi:MAG: hypothetical protein WA709_19305 [Stellaceae bacterium]
MDTCELTLTNLLADPMTLAVMAADRVDPAGLAAALSGLARRLEFAPPAAGGAFSGAPGGSAFREFFMAPSNERLPTRCDRAGGQR